MAETEENLFHGKLLRLAPLTEADSSTYASWTENAGYLRALDTDLARPLSAKDVTDRIRSARDDPNTLEFGLRTLTEDRLIGFVALHSIEWHNRTALLAIGIGEAGYRGNGYGTDALRLILRYAFTELNLFRVGLDVIANNTRALRAYEKAGFQREGAMRCAVLRDGQRHDLVLMGILRDEWQARVAD